MPPGRVSVSLGAKRWLSIETNGRVQSSVVSLSARHIEAQRIRIPFRKSYRTIPIHSVEVSCGRALAKIRDEISNFPYRPIQSHELMHHSWAFHNEFRPGP